MTPHEARNLAQALVMAAHHAEQAGREHIDLQAAMSARLAEVQDSLAAAIAETQPKG